MVRKVQFVNVGDAVYRAAKVGDARGLRVLLNCPEVSHWIWFLREALTIQADAIPRSWWQPSAVAAINGDTHCLRLLAESGFVRCTQAWVHAARLGHVNCLAVAVSHGCELEDSVLNEAVLSGQLACVEFLLEHGLPREPFVHFEVRTSPDQLECLQLMLDRGVAINPKTLIVAASHGDVDFLRWLHRRGVPLWRDARDATDADCVGGWRILSDDRPDRAPRIMFQWRIVECQAEPPGMIVIPWERPQRKGAPPDVPPTTREPCVLEDKWKALRYGAVFGAPLTQSVERAFAIKRKRTHAVLLCFKAAARLQTGPGPEKQSCVWAGMAALPSPLVEDLLILADLEIPESVVRRLPNTAPASAR